MKGNKISQKMQNKNWQRNKNKTYNITRGKNWTEIVKKEIIN